jgi:hypothetical protein
VLPTEVAFAASPAYVRFMCIDGCFAVGRISLRKGRASRTMGAQHLHTTSELLPLLAPNLAFPSMGGGHHVTQQPTFEGPSQEIGRALSAYTVWLLKTMTGGPSPSESGTDLVAAISNLQRLHFHDGSRAMSDLLIGHTEIVSLVFEHKMSVLRGAAADPLRTPEAAALVARQLSAIGGMQGICVESLNPVHIEHLPNPTVPARSETPRRIPQGSRELPGSAAE